MQSGMGGLFHLFDFNNNNNSNDMARKVLTHHKTYDEELEAPRNSFELQLETCQSYLRIKDVPFGLEEEWYERSCYPIESSMKQLINEELSRRSNTKQNAPSIVAKLMGVDTLPLDVKSVVWPNHKRYNYHHEIKSPEKGIKERNARSSFASRSMNLNSSRQMEMESSSVYCIEHRRDDKLGKPKRREHPQEEELEKFKKEFEAWQAARFRECARIIDVDSSISTQSLAQQTLNNEKLALYTKLKNGRKHEQSEYSRLQRCNSEVLASEHKQKLYFRSRSFGRDSEYAQRHDTGPTRIVVLKPGPHRNSDYEESLTTSSGTQEDRGSIEDFLEEVKERLKCELQGRALKRSSTVRGSGIETPFSEKPSYNSKQIVRHTTDHERDIGTNLPRSESTRSYSSEIQLNMPNSPEFVSRDTRRFLTERLRNVLKRETHSEHPVNGHLRPSALEVERRLKQTGDNLKDRDEHTRSFRRSNCGDDDDQVVNRDLSPRNLIRSLSAPVSGTSFGKLLLEDRNILTGAQIRRKHEAIEHVSVDPSNRKERFNFRKKVSSFRSTLRGRLFGKKIRSMLESNSFENEYIKDFVIGPRFTNFYDRNENSTEVPPSPASVCSTPDEFWRTSGYLSPISTPDVTIADENGMPQVFREISSNLNELRRQINELESEVVQEDAPTEQEADDPELIEIENPAKAYVRDLLVASGLYGGSSDQSLSRWDPFAKPISKSVFEEREEQHRKSTKENGPDTRETEEKDIDHKILYDLLNEALAAVLGPPVTTSSFRRKLTGLTPTPHGRKLLESVWQIVCERLYPRTDRSFYTLDSIIAWDLGNAPWSGLMDEEINILGRDVECLITGELVDEIIRDILIE